MPATVATPEASLEFLLSGYTDEV